MRVVGGTVRGRRLKRPPAGVRPTSDLVRGAIFDTLEAQGVDSSRVLDLYAGSGALGIEALSRGSERCDFVERSAPAVALIRENLTLTGMEDRARVIRMAAENVVERLKQEYSLVLADPPYDDDAAVPALERIARSRLLAQNGTLVWEHGKRREAVDQLGLLQLAWSRRYGDTQVSIYQREDADMTRTEAVEERR